MDRTSETNWQAGQSPGAARSAPTDPAQASDAEIPVWIHIPDLNAPTPQRQPVILPGPSVHAARTTGGYRPAGRPKPAPRRRVPSVAVLGGVVTAIVALAVLLLRDDAKKEGPTMEASPQEAAHAARAEPSTQVVTNQDPTAKTEAKTARFQPLPAVGANEPREARSVAGGKPAVGKVVPVPGRRPGPPPIERLVDKRAQGSIPTARETARTSAVYEASNSVRSGDLGPAVQHIHRIDPVQPIRR